MEPIMTPLPEQGALPEAGCPTYVSPEERRKAVGYTLFRAAEELDTLIAFAANRETVALVDAERRAIGALVTRAELLMSFLLARDTPSGLRVVGR
jgi:hypothetical protein